LASWRLFTPLLEHWATEKPSDFPNYAAGTWGPKAAEELLSEEGRKWRLM
jgi:glucose-6-phosphate 1-dehydrogenase